MDPFFSDSTTGDGVEGDSTTDLDGHVGTTKDPSSKLPVATVLTCETTFHDPAPCHSRSDSSLSRLRFVPSSPPHVPREGRFPSGSRPGLGDPRPFYHKTRGSKIEMGGARSVRPGGRDVWTVPCRLVKDLGCYVGSNRGTRPTDGSDGRPVRRPRLDPSFLSPRPCQTISGPVGVISRQGLLSLFVRGTSRHKEGSTETGPFLSTHCTRFGELTRLGQGVHILPRFRVARVSTLITLSRPTPVDTQVRPTVPCVS